MYNQIMENRTQARKEAFNKHAQAAKDLGDASLREIDRVLREQEEHLAWLQYEGFSPEQADRLLRDWQLHMHSKTTGSPEKPTDRLGA